MININEKFVLFTQLIHIKIHWKMKLWKFTSIIEFKISKNQNKSLIIWVLRSVHLFDGLKYWSKSNIRKRVLLYHRSSLLYNIISTCPRIRIAHMRSWIFFMLHASRIQSFIWDSFNTPQYIQIDEKQNRG